MSNPAYDTLQEQYLRGFAELQGDLPGRVAAQAYLVSSTAYYHDRLIGYGFIPQLYDMRTLQHLDWVASTTLDILNKVIRHFLDDPAYRQLFGFSPLLERLILLPTGYDSHIPITRLDLFLDEETLDFKFCEFNTDGTSAMNEDRETVNALSRSGSFTLMQQQHDLQRQELFEGWVDAFLNIYNGSKQAVAQPTIAIVDYLASASIQEFEEFRSRFEKRGYHCLICDVPALRFEHGNLFGTDIDHQRASVEGSVRIDAVYRRAVTSELLDELEGDDTSSLTSAVIPDSTSYSGAQALVSAVEALAICMIGGFKTQIAHCKQLFSVLHHPQTLELLTDSEQGFVRKHVPFTTLLDSEHIDLEVVIASKDNWIIKPQDGYASQGVFAGIDHADNEWRNLILKYSNSNYVVQTYCQQYPMLNTRAFPVDASYVPLYTSLEEAQSDETFDPLQLEPWNLLTGIYVYDGRFSGIFDRAGQSGLIVGFQGGITIGSLLVDYDAQAGLALRTRNHDND